MCRMVNSHFWTPELELSSCPQSNLAKIVFNFDWRTCPQERNYCLCFFLFCFGLFLSFFHKLTTVVINQILRREVDHHLEIDIKSHFDFACAKLKDTAKELGAIKRLLDTRLFIWRVGNFDQVLKQATNEGKEELKSDPFYSTTTESYGYKLQVSVCPNGNYQSSYLSVFIVVKRGDYDAILPWPLKKKVTFTLIDQQEDPNQKENVTTEFITGDHPHNYKRPLEEESAGIVLI